MTSTKQKRFEPSLLHVGDQSRVRDSRPDRFEIVYLSKVKISGNQIVGKNVRCERAQPEVKKLYSHIWVPPVLDPSNGESERVEFIKTGGRTAMFHKSPVDTIFLNMKRFGWSDDDTYQGFAPELKGAGAYAHLSGLTGRELERYATNSNDADITRYIRRLQGQSEVPLCISRVSDRDRPIGAQMEKYGIMALETSNSETLASECQVKFAPTLVVKRFPDAICERISSLDDFIDKKMERCGTPTEEFVQEIRMMPSTVRGIYIDKANTDDSLRTLISRISTDQEVLAKTLDATYSDFAKYMENVSTSTKGGSCGYRWGKVGDINIIWKKDYGMNPSWDQRQVDFFRKDEPYAYWIAKDIVIAAGTGAWFVDLESFDVGNHSFPIGHDMNPSADLKRKHELNVLCILRDFHRVLTQMEIGSGLLEGSGSVSYDQRRSLQSKALDKMADAVNKTDYARMKVSPGEISIELDYPHVREVSFKANYDIDWLRPRY